MKKSKVQSPKSKVEQGAEVSVTSEICRQARSKNFGLRTLDFGLEKGFTLLELIVTLTVLSILVFTALPLAQNAHKRQKEQELREALREVRLAIDEFKRDTIGACMQQGGNNPVPPGPGGPSAPTDPRSRVVIDDCTIFDAENPDRYPPTLEVLVEGVKVKARGLNLTQQGGVFDGKSTVFDDAPKELKKVYLRKVPIDPMTGEADWILRSSYQEKGTDSWDDVNVFDIRSRSDEEALNGEKYSDW
jgi:general secretion pathway protein G